MTLNFQRILKVPDVQDSPERTLELFDIGEMLADRYGVHKVEFQHYHIASTEPSYLKELRGRLAKSKSRMTQINLEFGNLNMSAPQQRDRLMAIDLTKHVGRSRRPAWRPARHDQPGPADAREQGLRDPDAENDGRLRQVEGHHRLGGDTRRWRRRRRGAGPARHPPHRPRLLQAHHPPLPAPRRQPLRERRQRRLPRPAGNGPCRATAPRRPLPRRRPAAIDRSGGVDAVGRNHQRRWGVLQCRCRRRQAPRIRKSCTRA